MYNAPLLTLYLGFPTFAAGSRAFLLLAHRIYSILQAHMRKNKAVKKYRKIKDINIYAAEKGLILHPGTHFSMQSMKAKSGNRYMFSVADHKIYIPDFKGGIYIKEK